MTQFPFDDDFINRRKTEYAVIIYLPVNLDQIIHPFRERYDPLYNKISSHITLAFPFHTNSSLDDLSLKIKSVIANHSPVLIELETIADFYPDSAIIYWSMKENKQLRELYYNLHSILEIPIPYKNYVPHVTLAREISPHRVEIVKDSIASYLPKETFYSSALDLITPLADFKYVSVRTFPFTEEY